MCSSNLDIKRKLQPGLNAVDGPHGGLLISHHFSHQRVQNVILVLLFICLVGCIFLFVLLHSLRVSGHALDSRFQYPPNVQKKGKMNRFSSFSKLLD